MEEARKRGREEEEENKKMGIGKTRKRMKLHGEMIGDENTSAVILLTPEHPRDAA